MTNLLTAYRPKKSTLLIVLKFEKVCGFFKRKKMKNYTINNENHKNLTSNVPFKKLPKWFQKAETRNAVIEYDKNKYYTTSLVWKNGVWKGGTWEDGVWEYGIWENGGWEDGIWKGGIWKGGFWEDGIWKGGIWECGIWYNGFWEDGFWEDGDWKNGTWESGVWKNGTWYNGYWYNGIWKNGFVYIRIKNSIWKVFYNSNTKEIKIGCKIKSIEEWEEWFSGLEEYTTERGTEEFKAIYKNYLLAKYAIELEIKD